MSAIPWLEAEAAAFPLFSMAAFNAQTTRIGFAQSGVLNRASADLASRFEELFRHRLEGMSIDTLRNWRDHAWFGGRLTGDVPLHDLLCRVAHELTVPHGDTTTLRHSPDDSFSNRALAWRWTSIRVPTDLMVAAAYSTRNEDPPRNSVDILTPNIRAVLAGACAETHLHVGAAVSFPILWAAVIQLLRSTSTVPASLARDQSNVPFGSGECFWLQLLTAAVARLSLARFLWERERVRLRTTFETFVRIPPWRASAIEQGFPPHTLYCVVSCFRGSQMTSRHETWRYYRWLTAKRVMTNGGDSVDLCLAQDPLAAWLPPTPNLAAPETRFATAALRYLSAVNDELFALVFWQYQRVREALRSYLVQSPGIMGLDWFAQHFDRIRTFRGSLRNSMYASAIRLQSLDTNLQAIEMRTAPSSKWHEVRDEVRLVAKSALQHQAITKKDPEVGLVLHFIKERDARGHIHSDPAHQEFRFRNWISDRWKQVRAIERAIRFDPTLLVILRGIDVANRELSIPTWCLVPLYSHLREASAEVASRLVGLTQGRIPPLHATVHAGEDYRRLVEGIRRVDEAFRFLLRTGDRIGHGSAAGENPYRWAARAPRVPQPREDRLDDLLWELELYGRGAVPPDAQRTERIRAEAATHAKHIYACSPALDELIASRMRRHELRFINALRSRSSFPIEDKLLHAHWHDSGVFQRGQQLCVVQIDDGELAFVQAAQRALRQLLAAHEITVESNPTSNLMISDYRTLTQHPAFSLSPIEGEPAESIVSVSVNTDDPITFMTRFAQEYAYAYHALVAAGISAQRALAWLTRARDAGMASRFTVEASRAKPILRRILRNH